MGKLKVFLPSSFSVFIRETNGADEITLSDEKLIDAGQNVNHYLAGIIVDSDLPTAVEGEFQKTFTPEEIEGWKACDKDYLTLKSRMYSLGNELVFTYRFNHLPKADRYAEDLSIFDQDLEAISKGKLEAVKDGSKVQLHPGGLNKKKVFNISSGKTFEYTYMTSKGQQLVLQRYAAGNANITDELFSRDLTWKVEGKEEWRKITNIEFLSSKELREIRTEIRHGDPLFTMLVNITSKDNKASQNLNAMHIPDFFYPGEA